MLGQELPALIQDGYTSFKVYMTYDLLRLDDGQMLDILALARREGALVMVHAENHDMIKWLTARLLEHGLGAPRYHAVAHARIAEGEATNRAVALSQLLDVPILIVHVSAAEAIDVIRDAQTKGLKIYGETCPQYLFLTADDIGMDLEGTKFCCSPPPRDQAAQEAVWRGLANGTFQVFSSDHAPYRYDETGKLLKGDKTTFKDTANGVPGIELRVPLLFSEGVGKGRHRPQPLCRADRDQPRQALRPLPEQGHDRGRQRRRHRDLGPGARSHGRPPGCCTTMSATRPTRARTAHRLAGDGAVARPDRRRGRQARRRARQRQFPALRPVGNGQAPRPPRPGTRLRRRTGRALV